MFYLVLELFFFFFSERCSRVVGWTSQQGFNSHQREKFPTRKD